VSGGYDAKFKIYANHVKGLVPGQLISYMSQAQSSGFWSCGKKEMVFCCSDCHNPYGSCQGCTGGDGCVSGQRLVPVPCPTAIPSGVFTSDSSVAEIHYTLTNEDGFYADLLKKYGVDRTWVKIDEHLVYLHPGCQYGWTKPPTPAQMDQCMHDKGKYWTGFPVPGDIVVSDPKALIADNADVSRELAAAMQDNAFWADMGGTVATYGDIVDSTSLPAFMMVAAVDSMDRVVETADAISEQDRKETILNFIMGFLMLIPGAGLALDALGMAAIRSAILLIGDIGDVALTVFSIVDNHGESALFDIFGYLFGRIGAVKGKVGTEQSFQDAAALHRGMSNEDLAKITPIRDNLNNVKSARGLCGL